MSIIGVTGTNGKTTCATLTHAILSIKGQGALFGTIDYRFKREVVPATHTTPDARVLQSMFRDMADKGCQFVVMEASSHALDQERLLGINLDAALFTNLTRDHLDYHKTRERYLEAKAKIFNLLKKSGTAVLNADDEVYGSLAKINSRIISYGIKNDADLRVKKIKSDLNGSVFRVYFSSKDIEISTPLIGEHNIYNILGSIGVALSRGITLEECGDVIRNFSGVAGRLERVETNRNFGLFVDYAHTDDGLENVLKSLRPFTAGRLLLLFGCGGERDRGKRPRMAGVAEHYADFVMLTSDNPRNEDENEILKEIITGFGEGYNTYEVQSDRRKAIERIIAMAGKDDVVLLAGKGHEDYQVIGDKKVPFSDKEEAKRVLKVQKGAVDA